MEKLRNFLKKVAMILKNFYRCFCFKTYQSFYTFLQFNKEKDAKYLIIMINTDRLGKNGTHS